MSVYVFVLVLCLLLCLLLRAVAVVRRLLLLVHHVAAYIAIWRVRMRQVCHHLGPSSRGSVFLVSVTVFWSPMTGPVVRLQ